MERLNPKINIQYSDGATIAILTDEKILEEVDINLLEASIMPIIEQPGSTHLIIDFSNVAFFSSAVLGLLIRISKKVNENGGKLRLCEINPKILEIFKITRLDKVFDICGSRDQAIQNFS
jgi:anti-sigma B factor antagonist